MISLKTSQVSSSITETGSKIPLNKNEKIINIQTKHHEQWTKNLRNLHLKNQANNIPDAAKRAPNIIKPNKPFKPFTIDLLKGSDELITSKRLSFAEIAAVLKPPAVTAPASNNDEILAALSFIPTLADLSPLQTYWTTSPYVPNNSHNLPQYVEELLVGPHILSIN